LYLYEIEFTIPEKFEIMEDMDIDLPEDIDKDDLFQYVTRKLHLGGTNFFDVQEEAIEIIEQVFFENISEDKIDFEIIGIKQIPDIFIANWPEKESPLIRAEKMADEDVMMVKCPSCDNIIRIAEDGWDWVKCKKCETSIEKNELLKLGKYWVIVKIGKDNPHNT
jgi:hypothetical protein